MEKQEKVTSDMAMRLDSLANQNMMLENQFTKLTTKIFFVIKGERKISESFKN